MPSSGSCYVLMRFCRCLIAVNLAMFLALSATSCETVKVRGAKKDNTISPTPANGGTRGPIVTHGFLDTEDARLKDWLSKEFDVKYVSMTPQLIFEQVPLSEIKYKTNNLPIDALPLNFQSKNISRRGILKKIANFWNLDMTFVTSAEGKPVAIKVTGPN